MPVSTPPRPDAVRVATPRRVAAVVTAAGVLGAACVLSLMVGNEPLSPATVLRALLDPGATDARDIVRGLRLDRTFIALAAGLALGAARPADAGPDAQPARRSRPARGQRRRRGGGRDRHRPPRHHRSRARRSGFALLGAAAASVAVYVLGSGGHASTTPIRLALAGAALTAVLSAYINGISLSSQANYDQMRFWLVGSVVGREVSVPADTAAVPAGRRGGRAARDAGTQRPRARGGRRPRARGRHRPAAPADRPRDHAALPAPRPPWPVRSSSSASSSPTSRDTWSGRTSARVVPLSMLLSATLLLVADTIGRVVADREVEAGIMTAFIGAPLFIALVLDATGSRTCEAPGDDDPCTPRHLHDPCAARRAGRAARRRPPRSSSAPSSWPRAWSRACWRC